MIAKNITNGSIHGLRGLGLPIGEGGGMRGMVAVGKSTLNL